MGEELLAQRLAELPHTFRVLRDRRIPRTRANIDNIVIGPIGVWGIDAKSYRGSAQRSTLTEASVSAEPSLSAECM